MIGIVVADFNAELTESMCATAQDTITKKGKEIGPIVHVPGVFETPFATKKLMEQDDVHGVVILGVVIQGKTDHDILITTVAAQSLMNLSLEHKVPIGLGIVGPRVSRDEATQRAGEYARRAAEAVLALQ